MTNENLVTYVKKKIRCLQLFARQGIALQENGNN